MGGSVIITTVNRAEGLLTGNCARLYRIRVSLPRCGRGRAVRGTLAVDVWPHVVGLESSRKVVLYNVWDGRGCQRVMEPVRLT
jgi:hypothetical protein